MNGLWQKYHNFILPAITGGLVLLLVLSYLFPNKVLDTYAMNPGGEGSVETQKTLPEGSVISYTLHTGNRPLRGIQPGIGIQGGTFEKGVLKYCVYKAGEKTSVSENSYSLAGLSNSLFQSVQEGAAQASLYEAQYIYLPIENYEDCNGDITIEFWYESNGDTFIPTLLLNDQKEEGAQTFYDGKETEGGLTGYYVYTHNTYPFAYDLKILIFLSLAVTACDVTFFTGKRGTCHEN